MLILVCVQNSLNEPVPIGLFPPKTAVVKHHLLAKDIIAKTPAPQPQAVLAFTGFDAFQFLDRVPTASVIRIALECVAPWEDASEVQHDFSGGV